MRNVLLLAVSVVTLSACSANQPPVVGAQRSVQLTQQPNAPVNPSGTAVIVDLANGDRATRVELTGLAPSTNYVAHYHLQGSASTTPCLSQGAAIPSSTMTGMTDADGKLVMRGLAPRADVDAATYLNVHTATAATPTTPADAGVACANLK